MGDRVRVQIMVLTHAAVPVRLFFFFRGSSRQELETWSSPKKHALDEEKRKTCYQMTVAQVTPSR